MQILIAIHEPPDNNTAAKVIWQNTIDTIAKEAMKYVGCEQLSKGCWLITGEASLRTLGFAISESANRNLRYRVLFLERASELPAQFVA